MDNEISQNTTPAAEQDQSMSPSMESPDRVSTGIPSLDTVLNGGLRSQRSYLVRDPPGNGRTALGLQLLSDGIVQLNTPSTERTVEIVKLRGSDTDPGRTRYRSRLAASRCFHSSSPTASPPPEETLTPGVPEVDELPRRGGGSARGTTTMTTSPSGRRKNHDGRVVHEGSGGTRRAEYHLPVRGGQSDFLLRCESINPLVTELVDQGTLMVKDAKPSALNPPPP